MHILSDRHSRSLFIHFNLIISLLSRISVTSSLRDFLVIRILRQQTAQDSVAAVAAAEAQRRRIAQRQQHGGSSADALAVAAARQRDVTIYVVVNK
jgi:hypothetical protein